MTEPKADAPDSTAASAEEALIPARMLNEVVYCPRLFHLEHVGREWEDSADTVSGRRVHRRVDAGPEELPAAAELPEDWKARAVNVSSQVEGIIAKIDLVDVSDGRVRPVDYKRGAAPDAAKAPGGVWPADRVQIGAQVLALRDAGYRCEAGEVYYAASKTKVVVKVDEALVAEVRAAVALARRLQADPVPPPPLVDSPKCPRCSLVGICLPDEMNALRQAEEEGSETPRVRRLVPSDDDRHPCYVQASGAMVTKSGDVLQIRLRDGTRQEARIREMSHLSVFGHVQVTTGVIQELCSRDIGLSFFSSGGWYYGSLGCPSGVNVHTRIAQFRAAADPEKSLALARAFVRGKILNARTLVRRNATAKPGSALSRLKQLAEDAARAPGLDTLLGIEGTAARMYFEAFAALLAPPDPQTGRFDFEGRNRRPPRDPVNALLSFAYALLLRECRVALLKVGFDPTVGFFHQPRPGRPALALDLMEEFRPLIADSTTLTAVNSGAVSGRDFVRAAGAVALDEGGRRAFLAAYERRMDQEVQHPVFGYRVSYRRVLEIQARLLSRVLTGAIPSYPGFLTR